MMPGETILVTESPTAQQPLNDQIRLTRPGSYYFSSSGGLGFGLPAAIGVQLAQPDRPAVAVLGDGTAQYTLRRSRRIGWASSATV